MADTIRAITTATTATIITCRGGGGLSLILGGISSCSPQSSLSLAAYREIDSLRSPGTSFPALQIDCVEDTSEETMKKNRMKERSDFSFY